MKHRILELRDNTFYPFGCDEPAPMVSVKDVLWMLEPSSSLGKFIMTEYTDWLKDKKPADFVDPKECERWREYMFKRAFRILSDLSELMKSRNER